MVGRGVEVVVPAVLGVVWRVTVAVLAVVFMFAPKRHAVSKHAVRTNTSAKIINFFMIIPPVLVLQG